MLLNDNFQCKIKGINSIRLTIDVESNIKKNLISMSILDGDGYSIKMENGNKRVISGSLVVLKANKQSGLYVLQGNTKTKGSTTTVTNHDKSILWHNRLKSLNYLSMDYLVVIS